MVLREISRPGPEEGGILVQINAASVNTWIEEAYQAVEDGKTKLVVNTG